MSSKETKDFLMFTIALVNGIAKSTADGSIGVGDIGYFLNALKDAPSALAGATLIPQELKSMTDEDRADLLASISAVDTGDIAKDIIIEKAIAVGIALLDMIAQIKK